MSKLDEDKVWATDLVRLIVNAEREGGGFRIYHDQAISEIVARLREARGVTGGATNGLDISIPHDEYMLALYLACWFGPPNEVMGFLLDRAAMAAMGDCCPSAYAVYLEETGRG